MDTSEQLTVSRFAAAAGVSADTVRFYERIGLLPAPARDANGYRRYDPTDVERLRFVKRAQQFGLSLDEIRQLLVVGDRGLCPCGHATTLLADRLRQVDQQISTLQQLRGDIASLLEREIDDSAGCAEVLVALSTKEELDGSM